MGAATGTVWLFSDITAQFAVMSENGQRSIPPAAMMGP